MARLWLWRGEEGESGAVARLREAVARPKSIGVGSVAVVGAGESGDVGAVVRAEGAVGDVWRAVVTSVVGCGVVVVSGGERVIGYGTWWW